VIKPISPKNVNKNDTLENTKNWKNSSHQNWKKILKYRMIQIMTNPIDFDDDNQPKLHQIKTNKNIEISSALENEPNAYDIMHYWYEFLQLTKVDGNIFLDLNKWRSN
jgi:hypothetical protein